MPSLLRQIVALLVVTIVSAGLMMSSAKAAMAVECEITSASTTSDTPADQSFPSHQGHPGHDKIATDAESTAHPHEGHDESRDAHASHCKAHACPSTAIPAFSDVLPVVAAAQSLTVIQPESLVELTVPEGLRRPPRG